MKDKVSIMLDTSGAGLHKRGYRKNSNEAPIKETLAAVMAKLSRVRTDGTLIDPFCGSGTILIEGAMLAMHIAPGLRRHFAAEKWKAVPGNIWDNERIAAKALERRDEGFLAFGYDIDPEAVRLTLENAKKAGVAQYISAEVRDIKDFSNDAVRRAAFRRKNGGGHLQNDGARLHAEARLELCCHQSGRAV